MVAASTSLPSLEFSRSLKSCYRALVDCNVHLQFTGRPALPPGVINFRKDIPPADAKPNATGIAVLRARTLTHRRANRRPLSFFRAQRPPSSGAERAKADCETRAES